MQLIKICNLLVSELGNEERECKVHNKKVLAFFLSVVLGFQIGIMPVQAAALSENLQSSTEIKDDKNSTTIKDSESVESNTEKEAVTIIESSSEKIQSTGFDEQKESQDAKSEEKAIFNKKKPRKFFRRNIYRWKFYRWKFFKRKAI